MDEIDPKLKTWGIVLGIAFFALAGLDFVVLKGDSVGGGSVDLRPDAAPLVLTITRPREDHLVEIRTRRRVRGEYEGQSIAFRLVDPDGRTLVEESEILSHKRRTFSFHPMKQGSYSLYAEENTLLGSSRGTGRVSVTVNDRRILSRLVGF